MLQRTHTIRLIGEPMLLSGSNEGEQLVRGEHPHPGRVSWNEVHRLSATGT